MGCWVQACEIFSTDIAHLYTNILVFHAKYDLQFGNYKHGTILKSEVSYLTTSRIIIIIIIIIIITHVECKNKSDTSNNWSDWNHFKIIQKILEQHTMKP
jgi:hypothetical protein